YATADVKPEGAAKLGQHDMQCVDCHNRPTHTFQLPERAVNRAMALGQIPVSLPFIRKKGVEILRAEYASSTEAARKIPAAIYKENVFPDLGVTWGTYKNNLGHTDYPGCFRCHDEAHTSSNGKTITQDCGACHEMVAVSAASPEVLRTLGLQERLSKLQRQ